MNTRLGKTAPGSRPAVATYARFGVALLSGLFALCVAAQVFLAGLALFRDAAQWATHAAFGYAIGLIPALLLLLSYPAGLPGKTKVKCALLLVLVLLVFISAIFAADIGYMAAVHPVIALGLFLNAVLVMRESLTKY